MKGTNTSCMGTSSSHIGTTGGHKGMTAIQIRMTSDYIGTTAGHIRMTASHIGDYGQTDRDNCQPYVGGDECWLYRGQLLAIQGQLSTI